MAFLTWLLYGSCGSLHLHYISIFETQPPFELGDLYHIHLFHMLGLEFLVLSVLVLNIVTNQPARLRWNYMPGQFHANYKVPVVEHSGVLYTGML